MFLPFLFQICLWFIFYGLSFFVSYIFSWTEQGKIFLFISLGMCFLIILVISVFIIIVRHFAVDIANKHGISFKIVFYALCFVIIILFMTYVVSKLFDIDFFVSYQVITLGQCLCIKLR